MYVYVYVCAPCMAVYVYVYVHVYVMCMYVYVYVYAYVYVYMCDMCIALRPSKISCLPKPRPSVGNKAPDTGKQPKRFNQK